MLAKAVVELDAFLRRYSIYKRKSRLFSHDGCFDISSTFYSRTNRVKPSKLANKA